MDPILQARQVSIDGIFCLNSIKQNAIFANGKPTGENVGIKLRVLTLPDLEPVYVKLPAVEKLPITNEQIAEKISHGVFTFVKFDGFAGKLWVDKTAHKRISASAKDVEIYDTFPNVEID